VLHRQRGWLLCSWLILVSLFVSPLCALSSALFSVRVAHHVVLIALAAPVLVLSLPGRWCAPAFFPSALGIVFVLHVGIVWLWHAPGPYTAAMTDDLLFWAMQLSLLISAVALWLAVLSPAAPFGYALTLLLGSVIQMGLLGAVITFARVPLYLPHFATTEPFGLSALADQQLAGLIMWVPATLPYLGAALFLIGRGLARAPAAVRAS
jgi:putative membrane protein